MTSSVKRFVLIGLITFVLSFFSLTVHRGSAEEPFRVILISDSHLGFKKSNEAFQNFLKDVQELPFKVKYLINNGDIAEVGTEKTFQQYLDGIRSLDVTAFNVIGNHDTRWAPIGKDLY